MSEFWRSGCLAICSPRLLPRFLSLSFPRSSLCVPWWWQGRSKTLARSICMRVRGGGCVHGVAPKISWLSFPRPSPPPLLPYTVYQLLLLLGLTAKPGAPPTATSENTSQGGKSVNMLRAPIETPLKTWQGCQRKPTHMPTRGGGRSNLCTGAKALPLGAKKIYSDVRTLRRPPP